MPLLLVGETIDKTRSKSEMGQGIYAATGRRIRRLPISAALT